jgi:hypothetical protein
MPESESAAEIAPAEKLEGPAPPLPEPLESPEPAQRTRDLRSHPDLHQLERFMRGELSGTAARTIVRHLLAGCPQCVQITRRFWALGDS